jgi:hypothetical protein
MTNQPIRIWRSPESDFYGDETLDADDIYDTEYLEQVAADGFSAVWLRAILHDVVQTGVFPELGGDADAHQESLRRVLDRGQDAGTGLWLYVQPPLALDPDHAFWNHHPKVAGVTRERADMGPKTTLCVSHPTVREYLREATANLSRALPGLDGAILITASELMQHCYTGHDVNSGDSTGCERCDEREPKDVIADIVGCVHEGFDRAGQGASVVAWNWSWNFYEPEPQRDIIEALPEDVTLMAGFERGGRKDILGKTRDIDEYALSYAGPSERFERSVAAARERGMAGVMAKLQVGTTHELATVPNLPVIGTLYEKARGMRELDIPHYMGCWNFGNLLTANTAAFNRFLDADPLPERDPALRGFAEDYLPGCDAEGVVASWETFLDAMDWYPFSNPFIYRGPVNHALVRPIEPGPLDGKPIGRSWEAVEPRGDDLSNSIDAPYTLEEIVTGLGKLWRTWTDGVETFERSVADCDVTAATEETNSVRAAGHCFHSAWNLYRAYRLRRDWDEAKRSDLLAIARDEREHLREVLPVVERDDRLGFHQECQAYQFTADGIETKLADLDALLDDA